MVSGKFVATEVLPLSASIARDLRCTEVYGCNLNYRAYGGVKMFEYTYTLPFEETKFAEIVIKELKRTDLHDIAYLLKDSKVSINNTGIYSNNVGGGRWNAYAIYIEFYVNPLNIAVLEEKQNKKEISVVCNRIIPANVGFDIKDVEFFPDYTIEYDSNEDLVDDLVKTVQSQSKRIIDLLSPELMNKGFEMSEAYIYMYAIENTIRGFIENVLVTKYGGEYFNKIKLTKNINTKLSSRKVDASSKKWLSFNSESDIYFLDFIELGDIIRENWTDFSSYFPNQEFILTKVSELADARNRIAHNSYIGETERTMLKAYYKMITSQIIK